MIVNITILLDLTACSPIHVHRRFGRTHCLYLQTRRCVKQRARIKQQIYSSSTLKIEALCPSETLVKSCWTTRRHVFENSALQRLTFSDSHDQAIRSIKLTFGQLTVMLTSVVPSGVCSEPFISHFMCHSIGPVDNLIYDSHDFRNVHKTKQSGNVHVFSKRSVFIC